MTVCVAALSDGGQNIISVTDRMISGPWTVFDSPAGKIFFLTSSLYVLWAGEDASFLALIHSRLREEINSRVKAEPETWLTVGEVAEAYQRHYSAARQERIAHAVFEPLGLTFESFLKAESSLSEATSQRLISAALQYQVPAIEALIVGMDRQGAIAGEGQGHIYKFANYGGGDGSLSCEDALGFAVIGSGSFHAESQLMAAQYGPSTPTPQALFQVYLAKRRADVAPGVGEHSFVYVFTPRPRIPAAVDILEGEIHQLLFEAHRRMKAAEADAFSEASTSVERFLLARAKPATPPGQVVVTGSGGGSVGPWDGKGTAHVGEG